MSKYVYVVAVRDTSAGTPPHGGYNPRFVYGVSGPHTEKEARRIIAVSSGSLIERELGDLYIKSIKEHGAPSSMKEVKERLEQLRASGRVEEEVFDVEAEIDDVLTDDATKEYPSYDEIGYHEAIRIMTEAGFDWREVGKGRTGYHAKKAWKAFTSEEDHR